MRFLWAAAAVLALAGCAGDQARESIGTLPVPTGAGDCQQRDSEVFMSPMFGASGKVAVGTTINTRACIVRDIARAVSEGRMSEATAMKLLDALPPARAQPEPEP